MRGWRLGVVVLVAVIVSAMIVGPYRYEHIEQYGQNRLVRVSRISGRAEWLSTHGWLPMSLPLAGAQ